jgi:hypothetical protein
LQCEPPINNTSSRPQCCRAQDDNGRTAGTARSLESKRRSRLSASKPCICLRDNTCSISRCSRCVYELASTRPNVDPKRRVSKCNRRRRSQRFEKIFCNEGQCSRLDPLIGALIEIMIAWRNRSVHPLGDNEASPESWNTIRTSKEELSKRFSGLTIGGFDQHNPPSSNFTVS